MNSALTYAATIPVSVSDAIAGAGLAFAAVLTGITVLFVILRIRRKSANIGLCLVSLAASFLFASKAGFGISGAIGLLYGLFLAIVAILAIVIGLDGFWVTIGLAIGSFVLAAYFGGADLYCVHHPAC